MTNIYYCGPAYIQSLARLASCTFLNVPELRPNLSNAIRTSFPRPEGCDLRYVGNASYDYSLPTWITCPFFTSIGFLDSTGRRNDITQIHKRRLCSHLIAGDKPELAEQRLYLKLIFLEESEIFLNRKIVSYWNKLYVPIHLTSLSQMVVRLLTLEEQYCWVEWLELLYKVVFVFVTMYIKTRIEFFSVSISSPVKRNRGFRKNVRSNAIWPSKRNFLYQFVKIYLRNVQITSTS